MKPEILEFLKSQLKKGLIECQIPGHMHSALEDYLLRGIEPGGFLFSVLSNDFKGACSRADSINLRHLQNYMWLICNFMPQGAQGSPEKVQAWIDSFKQNGSEPNCPKPPQPQSAR